MKWLPIWKRKVCAFVVTETRKGKWIFYSINKEHGDYPFIQTVLEQLPGQDEMVTDLEAQGLRICCE